MIFKNNGSEKIEYDYSDYPIYIKRSLLSSYPNYSAPSHWHDDIEFVLVLAGEMQYNISGNIITLTKGQGVFVNARQLHFGFSMNKKECDFICILLHPMLLCGTPAYENDFVLPLINNTDLPFIHLYPEIPWHQDLSKQLKRIYVAKNENIAQLKIQAAFLTIWILLCENISLNNDKKTQQSRDLNIIKNMIGYIQKNYMKKISLSDIAISGAVGQSKCCKLFAKYLGQTPTQNLTQYRINKSMELLKASDMTIIEIAEETGFTGASYYAEVFKKWTGKSPTEYRHTALLPQVNLK